MSDCLYLWQVENIETLFCKNTNKTIINQVYIDDIKYLKIISNSNGGCKENGIKTLLRYPNKENRSNLKCLKLKCYYSYCLRITCFADKCNNEPVNYWVRTIYNGCETNIHTCEENIPKSNRGKIVDIYFNTLNNNRVWFSMFFNNNCYNDSFYISNISLLCLGASPDNKLSKYCKKIKCLKKKSEKCNTCNHNNTCFDNYCFDNYCFDNYCFDNYCYDNYCYDNFCYKYNNCQEYYNQYCNQYCLENTWCKSCGQLNCICEPINYKCFICGNVYCTCNIDKRLYMAGLKRNCDYKEGCGIYNCYQPYCGANKDYIQPLCTISPHIILNPCNYQNNCYPTNIKTECIYGIIINQDTDTNCKNRYLSLSYLTFPYKYGIETVINTSCAKFGTIFLIGNLFLKWNLNDENKGAFIFGSHSCSEYIVSDYKFLPNYQYKVSIISTCVNNNPQIKLIINDNTEVVCNKLFGILKEGYISLFSNCHDKLIEEYNGIILSLHLYHVI